MQILRNYFENETEQRRALAALGDWFDPAELNLYEQSRCAFGLTLSAVEALRSFEKIYSELASRRWNVFRPYSPGECWPAEKIFETIKRDFAELAWRSGINLLTSWKTITAFDLQSRLTGMSGIKRNKGYPIMTVSKFLHFYNPGLFPIYDTVGIWDTVCNGYFKRDFREFCEIENLPYRRFANEDTIDFLPAYMRWANSLLSSAHARYMQVFVEWLAEQPGTDLAARTFDPKTLLARAFEYTALGAARAESAQRV